MEPKCNDLAENIGSRLTIPSPAYYYDEIAVDTDDLDWLQQDAHSLSSRSYEEEIAKIKESIHSEHTQLGPKRLMQTVLEVALKEKAAEERAQSAQARDL